MGGFVAWVVVDSRNGNCGGFLAEISCVWLRERGMVKMVVEIGAALAAAFLFPVKIRETRKIPEQFFRPASLTWKVGLVVLGEIRWSSKGKQVPHRAWRPVRNDKVNCWERGWRKRGWRKGSGAL